MNTSSLTNIRYLEELILTFNDYYLNHARRSSASGQSSETLLATGTT